MNFKHETYEWGGFDYIRVSKKRFENFVRFFREKIEGDGFMGWLDYYDWSLNNNFKVTKKTSDEDFWNNLDKCRVARKYVDSPNFEYWIRLDYLETNHYDLNTIVSKPRPKRLTKKEKLIVDGFCKLLDECFKAYSLEAATGTQLSKLQNTILDSNEIKIAPLKMDGLTTYDRQIKENHWKNDLKIEWQEYDLDNIEEEKEKKK